MEDRMFEKRIKNGKCPCPYLPCKLRGNCVACAAKEIKDGGFPNCIENQVEEFKGCLSRKRPSQTIICDTYEEMSRTSAELIAGTVQKKPDALFSLSAGNTAIRTYEILKEMSDCGKVDFTNARFVQLDEWLDLEDQKENCGAFLRKYFFDPLGIREKQIMMFHVNAKDLDDECYRMDDYIKAAGDIDCMLLGVGMNGHIALNEPGENFDSGTKVVTLSETTKEVGKKYFSKDVRLTRGITLGMRQVFDAKQVILQAGTKSKAEIMAKMYDTRPQIGMPATVMFLLGNGIVVMDKDAAGLIQDI